MLWMCIFIKLRIIRYIYSLRSIKIENYLFFEEYEYLISN